MLIMEEKPKNESKNDEKNGLSATHILWFKSKPKRKMIEAHMRLKFLPKRMSLKNSPRREKRVAYKWLGKGPRVLVKIENFSLFLWGRIIKFLYAFLAKSFLVRF